jgi:hypothetical protein
MEVIENVRRPPPADAQLLVRLGVTPVGEGHDAQAQGEVGVGRDGSLMPQRGMLSFCVESAIAGVAYPKGPEALDVEVSVAWTASGMVNTSGRIVGRHEAPSRAPDL